MRPKVRRLDNTTDTHMITPTKAKAVIRLLLARSFSKRSHMSSTSYWRADRGHFCRYVGQWLALVSATDQGNGAAADHHRTNRRQDRHRAAVQGGHDVLLRGHRHDHWNVHRAPETDAHLAILGHAATFLHPQPRADQQDHGDPDPADVGLHAQ